MDYYLHHEEHSYLDSYVAYSLLYFTVKENKSDSNMHITTLIGFLPLGISWIKCHLYANISRSTLKVANEPVGKFQWRCEDQRVSSNGVDNLDHRYEFPLNDDRLETDPA